MKKYAYTGYPHNMCGYRLIKIFLNANLIKNNLRHTFSAGAIFGIEIFDYQFKQIEKHRRGHKYSISAKRICDEVNIE